MPRTTMMATMMSTILRALLPPVGAGATGAEAAGAGVTGAAAGAGELAVMPAPHLLQNLVPGVRLAPQELQNAISHLRRGDDSARRASISKINVSRGRGVETSKRFLAREGRASE